MLTLPMMIKTVSSNVASHAYVVEESSLYVAFKSNDAVIYRYDVTADEYRELLQATSFGSHLARQIKPRGHEKITVD